MLLHYVGEDVSAIVDTLTVPEPQPDAIANRMAMFTNLRLKLYPTTLNHKSVLTTMCITFGKMYRDRMKNIRILHQAAVTCSKV